MGEMVAWVVAGLILAFRFALLAALVAVVWVVVSSVRGVRRASAARGAPAK
jgi:hypothetical protein